MRFIKIKNPDEIVDYISQALSEKLDQNQKVLWLLSGGSAIGVEVKVAKKLNTIQNLDNLKIMLGDERYGQPGHKDSNYTQLQDAGFLLEVQPVLAGFDLGKTAQDYQSQFTRYADWADYILCVAGLGTDGHTLGIKPASPALTSQNLVEGYEWQDYIRLSLTPKAIERFREVVVYACGPEKKPQLERLAQNLPETEQVAQVLKRCPKVLIFNDQLS